MTPVKRALTSTTADMTVKIVAVVALTLSVYIGIQQRQDTRCLAEYNDASNRATASRYAAAEQDRQAQDELFRSIAEDPRRGVDALRDYTEQRRQANEQRQANPLPAPPSQRCG